MPTIQQQLNQLKADKATLNTMLNTMGVETTGSETFTELAPLVGKIVTDPILQDKSITITENGTTSIVADSGYNGLNNVEIVTNVLNSSGYINLLDATNWEIGGWVVRTQGNIDPEYANDNYRCNTRIKVTAGETLYLSKGLCCYFNVTQNNNNLTGDLVITVPSGATEMTVRTFAKDFETFNAEDYIISRTPIIDLTDELETYNSELTKQETKIATILEVLNSKLQSTTE